MKAKPKKKRKTRSVDPTPAEIKWWKDKFFKDRLKKMKDK